MTGWLSGMEMSIFTRHYPCAEGASAAAHGILSIGCTLLLVMGVRNAKGPVFRTPLLSFLTGREG